MSDQPEIDIVILGEPKTDDELIEIANDLIRETIDHGYSIDDVTRDIEREEGYGTATITIYLKWKAPDEHN